MIIKPIALLLGCSLILTACASGGPLGRKGPDEFAVGRNQPLVVPPDFSLTPPRPGESRPLNQDGAQNQAIEALFGPGTQLPPKTPGEQSLLDRAGAGRVDPAVRSTAGDPQTATVNKGAFLRELIDAPVTTRDPATAAVTIGG